MHTLTEMAAGLRELQDGCFVIGSSALVLSDVKIAETHDIDLLTSVRDADLLKKIWAGRGRDTYRPDGGERFRSNFARFAFTYLDVEVMGGLEVFHGQQWNKLQIEEYDVVSVTEYLNVKIPTRKESARILLFFDRDKDIAKLHLLG